MTNNVAANYTIPTILNSLKPAATTATAKADSSTASTTGTAATTLGTTFLSLLVKELQNQDPTAPMDSTAMVGQMISLNQLDQLISINQTLGGATTTGAVQGVGAQATSAVVQPASANTAAATALPFDPNTMMPVGMPSAGSAAVANNFNSPLNVASTGFSGTSNTNSGGK